MANSTQHGGEGKDLKGGKGGMFSPTDSNYRGPENWTPSSKVVNPDDVTKSASNEDGKAGIPA